MRATLTVVRFRDNEPEHPVTLSFGPEGSSLGRGRRNHLVLPDPKRWVSNEHAHIQWHNGKFVLIDHSRNGTYLRSALQQASGEATQRVDKDKAIALTPGDEILIGQYALRFDLGDGGAGAVSTTKTLNRGNDAARRTRKVDAPTQILGFDDEDDDDDVQETLIAGMPTGALQRPGARGERDAVPQRPAAASPRRADANRRAPPPEPSPPQPPRQRPSASATRPTSNRNPSGPLGLQPAPAATVQERPIPASPPRAANPPEQARAGEPVDLAEVFVQALGLESRAELPVPARQLLWTAAALLRRVTKGLIETLARQHQTKQALGLPAAGPGGPLGLDQRLEDSLALLLMNPELGPNAADGAFAQLHKHEEAMLEATRQAVAAQLSRLDPARFAPRQRKTLGERLNPWAADAHAWQRYVTAYQALQRQMRLNPTAALGNGFADAYRQALSTSAERPQPPVQERQLHPTRSATRDRI